MTLGKVVVWCRNRMNYNVRIKSIDWYKMLWPFVNKVTWLLSHFRQRKLFASGSIIPKLRKYAMCPLKTARYWYIQRCWEVPDCSPETRPWEKEQKGRESMCQESYLSSTSWWITTSFLPRMLQRIWRRFTKIMSVCQKRWLRGGLNNGNNNSVMWFLRDSK